MEASGKSTHMKGPSGEFCVYIEWGWRKLFRKSGRTEEEILDWEGGCVCGCRMEPVYCEDFLRLIWIPLFPPRNGVFQGCAPGPCVPGFSLNMCQALKGNTQVGDALWRAIKLWGPTRWSEHFSQVRCIARGSWEIRNREPWSKISIHLKNNQNQLC